MYIGFLDCEKVRMLAVKRLVGNKGRQWGSHSNMGDGRTGRALTRRENLDLIDTVILGLD
jgi:hypothetical protein